MSIDVHVMINHEPVQTLHIARHSEDAEHGTLPDAWNRYLVTPVSPTFGGTIVVVHRYGNGLQALIAAAMLAVAQPVPKET